MVIQNNRDMNLKLLRILIIISVFHLSISNLIAQEEQLNIQANHKVFTPAGKGPFSTIIAIPGCSGVSLNGAETDEERLADEGDRLFRRHYTKMVERLKKEGFLVVVIDYLSAENVLNTCDWEIHPKRVGEYVTDAISFVKKLPDVDISKIHLIGWSHGGEGILSWLSDIDEVPQGVLTAVTVYPGCSTIEPWKISLPVLLLIGESDDIALPSICNELVKSLDRITNVKVKSYPGARHGFDMTEGPAILSVGEGYTIGRNPRAGSDAWIEILKFLNMK
jgi:dienelactone hydrolase